ncbi:MAG: hypothetical protein B7Z37_12895 [Verrucomicrobia bacterium 12-59-8]|nr:MAG: hypothetical protein B7Z37_12895 [Verrucomicrobia bacterium 12-59-8]
MKTLLRGLAAALLACALTACPETTVNDDFGLKPAALKAADWNGTWTPVDGETDDAVQFTVTNAAQGLILMTERGKKDAKPVEFALRRATADAKLKLCYAIAQERDDKKPGAASLLLMREADDGILYTWIINHDTVAAALQSGQLQGTVKTGKDGPHSHLDSTPTNATQLLEPQFWNWSEPTCLKRVKE